ncbi:MAG TPA: D-glycero-beta-D-manno-heptose-7-phosphate kinase [Desulfobacteraceae bacterium]|nr:D-glycero-beta-D-manno-heptose-7-phosphate kinase [Desulfobacteraceae bacterium]
MEKIVPVQDRALLKEAVDRFHRARTLVLGDVMLDQYLWGKVSRISPEAPVPVVEIQRETKMLGGAANVINNIFSLGARPLLYGVIGNDGTGREVMAALEQQGINTAGILVEEGRPTSMKTRVVAHSQQVVRVDRESRNEIGREMVEKILAFVDGNAQDLDVIIVSDYGKGVVSPDIVEGLRRLKKSWGGVIAVDPKVGSFPLYRGVDVITPNHHEAGAYCGLEINDREGLIAAGEKILGNLGCGAVLITQGEQGMTLFERGGKVQHIRTAAKKVYDVTGAGDTVIATFCLGLASGLSMVEAAVVSNLAAGIVVGEVGTSTVNVVDLKNAIGNMRLEG